ncbi:unnamed protein product [Owenia fusiformis]|uniref:Uncharacterized protein n=1 Tax=Owenia fusiformis TaxID=6347 RepID=A0A8J1TVR9_OWEFU|nr:unnamed protein product [Owenia fusiformis]
MTANQFEDVIEQLGGFGPYQRRIFLLVSLFETPAAWAMLLPVFTGATPTWSCPLMMNYTYTNHDNENVTGDHHGNRTVDHHGNYSSGNMTYAETGACSSDGSICQSVQYSKDYTSVVSEWGLICNQDYVSDLITTVQMVGVLVGACITGQLADTFGRRKIFYIIYALLLGVGFASSFANSWQLYAACRFFVGGLIGGTMVVNFVLPMEFISPRWRTFCGCVGFWAVGVMTLPIFAYFIRDWRHLSMATSACGSLLLLTWWFVPESARWLIQKGRLEEARQIIRHIAKYNNKPVPDLTFLEQYVEEKEKKQTREEYSYIDLFRSPTTTKCTLIICYAWFVCSSTYYGLSLNVKNLSGSRYLNFFISGLVEIPALLLVLAINNRIGRRKTIFILLSIGGLSCFVILFIDLAGKLEELSVLVTVLAMLGKSGISGAWAASQIIAAELFPTLIRNIGVGACSMSARVGGIVAPQIVFLTKFGEPIPFILFGSFALVCAVLICLLPETLNKPLEDIVQDWSWRKSTRSQNGHVKANGTLPDRMDTQMDEIIVKDGLVVIDGTTQERRKLIHGNVNVENEEHKAETTAL